MIELIEDMKNCLSRLSLSCSPTLLFLALLAFSAPATLDAASRPSDRPDILLVTIDTLRADRLGCYGAKTVETPAIDTLARRGLLFERAFAHTPLTLPSHTSILLGLTPNAHGIHDNANFIVREGFTTLAEWLKKLGYATGAFVGAFPLDSRFGLTRGFDVYDDNYGSQGPMDPTFVERPAAEVVRLATEWLKSAPRPWFCWVHCFDPHQPYNPPEPFRTRYPDRPYDGEIAYVDSALAPLLEALERGGGKAGTIVILTADHGESLGEHGEATHGYFAYNATLRVPLVIAAPGLQPARVDRPASHVDIFPTICRLLGEKELAGLHGRALIPVRSGRQPAPAPVYFESLAAHYNRGWAPLRGFIEGGLKFIESPIPELYDLAADPAESDNLAPKTDLAPFRKKLADLIRSEYSPLSETAGQAADRETIEKLRSLGYAAAVASRPKKVYGERDDLKTLLPYHAKWMKATAAYHAGRTEEGMSLLREIIAERKDFDLAYTYLANFYKQQGRQAEALALLQGAVADNPESFRLLTAYGITLIDSGRMDEAIEVLERSLSLIDFDPETWNYLGVAYWNKGRFDRAQEAYERALAIDGDYPIVLNNLGALYLSMFLKDRGPSSLQKAEESFRRAVELDPKYASAWNGLGAARYQSRDYEGAVAAWARAVELKPDFDMPLYNLGTTLLGLGRKSEALAWFTRYKEVAGARLSPAEAKRLEALMEKCK
jgi:arylsulfatase A-like enzyme/Flp pilus assembly protein TadD